MVLTSETHKIHNSKFAKSILTLCLPHLDKNIYYNVFNHIIWRALPKKKLDLSLTFNVNFLDYIRSSVATYNTRAFSLQVFLTFFTRRIFVYIFWRTFSYSALLPKMDPRSLNPHVCPFNGSGSASLFLNNFNALSTLQQMKTIIYPQKIYIKKWNSYKSSKHYRKVISK